MNGISSELWWQADPGRRTSFDGPDLQRAMPGPVHDRGEG